MRQNRLGLLLVLCLSVILIVACSHVVRKVPVTNVAATIAVTSTPTASSSPSPTPTQTFTPTPTPSLTPTPTDSPSPTPSPTLALPVVLTTPFPRPEQVITAGNVNQIRELAYFGSPVNWRVIITADDRLGFVHTGRGLSIYDVDTGEIAGHYDFRFCAGDYHSCGLEARLMISYDGQRFAILGRDEVQVWDRGAGLLLTIPYMQSYSVRVRLSPDGKVLALRDSESHPILYDIDTGLVIEGLSHIRFGDFQFSPDGDYYAEWQACSNCPSQGAIWRTSDWSKVRDFRMGTYGVVRAFSNDGSLVALQDTTTLSVIRVEDWRLRRQITIQGDDKSRVTKGVLFSPSGEFISRWQSVFDTSTLTREDVVTVWKLSDGVRLSEAHLSNGHSNDHARIEQGILAAQLNDEGTFIFHEREIPNGVMESLGIDANGPCAGLIGWSVSGWTTINVHYDDNAELIKLWSHTQDNSGIVVIQRDHAAECLLVERSVFLGQDGAFYAAQKADGATAYEVRLGINGNGPALGTANSQAGAVYPEWLSADGKYLLFSGLTHFGGFSHAAEAELWDIESGTQIQRWPGSIAIGVNANRDGDLLAIVTAYEQFVYQVSERRVLYRSDNQFRARGFTEAGELILVELLRGHDPWWESAFEISLANLKTQTRRSIATVLQNGQEFPAVASSPDGSLLAVGMRNGAISVLDMQSGQELSAWDAHDLAVAHLEFAVDGTQLVSVGSDGYVRIWGIWP